MKLLTVILLVFVAGVSIYLFQNENNSLNDDLWLEEVTGEKALHWVKTENQRTTSHLEQNPNFSTIQEEAASILMSRDKLISGSQFDGYFFNFWQDGKNIKGLWRRQLWSDFLAGKKNWENLIDFDQLSHVENRSWVFKGANCLKGSTRCLINLSDGGKDASSLREYDLVSKSFVTGGFSAPASKSEYIWKNLDEILVASTFGDDSITDSGYAKKIKVWKRGLALESSPSIFDGQQKDVSVWVRRMEDGDKHHFLLGRAKTFFTSTYFLYHDNQAIDLNLPEDAELQTIINGKMVLLLKSKSMGMDSGDLVSLAVEDALSGNLKATLIFRPHSRQAVEKVRATKDQLLVSYLDDVKGRLAVFTFGAGKWVSKTLAFEDNASIGIFGTDSDSNEFLSTSQNFITPPTLYVINSQTHSKKVLQQLPASFDATDLIVKQVFTTSKDGTRIPYFLIHNKDIALDGTNPTVLYGYGGFEISLNPFYLGPIGKIWLERGGVYAVANIRGGGEYGPKWHQAALKKNRHLAYQDFISVAEDLIASKVSSPEKLAIRGGSNGGLLVGAVAMQRPDLFKGVLCLVPLLDMLRFHELLAGASWMGEYGNPEDADMNQYIKTYSPYQNLATSGEYPEIFFITSTKDDRVHPGHARRMAHKMQTFNHPFYYYENIEGGHSASANLKQTSYRYALEFTYLMEKIGLANNHQNG